MKLLAIDSNSLLNRAFYGVRPLTNKDGVFTNGIYGFFQIFLKLAADLQPDGVAFAFDLKAPTFRHKMYEGYKAQRKGMPPELAMQLPYLKELITALGYTIVEQEGYEADDILGTLSLRCAQQGGSCYIATGDRDSLQLVGEQVTVILASSKMGKAEYLPYDPQAILEKYGVTPSQLIDVKALMGDTSDNIPGVAGVGEKTALSLISQFSSLDEVYAHLEDGGLRPALKAKLEKDRDLAYLSQKLARIDRNVPIDAQLSDFVRREPDKGKAYAIFGELEMYTVAQRFALSADDVQEQVKEEAAPAGKTLRVYTQQDCPDWQSRIQTHQEQPLSVSVPVLFSFEGENLSAFGFVLEDGLYLIEQGVESQAAALLRSGVSLKTHNCKQLYRFAMEHEISLGPVVFDTMLAGYLLSPNATEYSVEKLLEQYSIPAVPLEGDTQQQGFCQQCAAFPQLCNCLEQKIAENEQQSLLTDIEIPLSEVLASMELLGFALDVEGITEFGKQLDVSIQSYQQAVWDSAGYEFNINSPKQLGEVLFGKLGLPAKKKTKSGYSTNAEVLESLRGKHPIIEEILEYRKVTKLKSTYVDGLLKVVSPDGRVRSRFNQTETRTGRISSTEPNLQNIPVRTELGSNLRKFFRAKEGCVLVDADYSQIELRVLASISEDKNMIEAFRQGEDIHTNTASQVFGMPVEYVTPLMRSRAKAVNFGIVYGIGAFSLSGDIGVSVAEADRYIKNYLKTFSGVREYMEKTKKLAAEQGYVTTLFHRRRYLPELTSSNRVTRAFGERVAMNTPIQGTAADIIKIAMVRVYRRLKAENLQSRLLLQIHDELIVEAPQQEAQRVQALLKEEMEQAVQLEVPMLVEAKIGKTWYESK